LEPESAPTHYLRSLALEAIGNLDEAVEEVMKAVELDPEDSNYHRQLGDIYVHGNPLAAEKWYRNALKLNPNDVRALNNLGVVLLATKREAQARMAYRAALLLDPALDVAKLNVHRSISNQFKRLSRGVVYPPLFVLGITCSLHMILAAVAWLGCSSLDAVLKSHRYAMILLLIYGAPLLYFPIAILSSYIYKSWQLRRTDPQLYHLYKRIAEDKERGRL
jgi:tetratricopeptide (TPR) repeat protein